MLDPIPDLVLYEPAHWYMYRGDWVMHNVGEVVSHDMSPFAKDAIEKHRHGPDGWELRGKVLHSQLQARLNGEPFVAEDRWDTWLNPLFAEPLFQGIETLATEYLLVDRYRPVAGSADFIVRYKDDKSFVLLGDLKTVSSTKAVTSRKSPLPQLGAYARMFQQWHPGIKITACVTVVSGPDKCKVRMHSPEDDCIPAWEKCWSKFEAQLPVL